MPKAVVVSTVTIALANVAGLVLAAVARAAAIGEAVAGSRWDSMHSRRAYVASILPAIPVSIGVVAVSPAIVAAGMATLVIVILVTLAALVTLVVVILITTLVALVALATLVVVILITTLVALVALVTFVTLVATLTLVTAIAFTAATGKSGIGRSAGSEHHG